MPSQAAIEFDGINDYLQLPSTSNFKTNNEGSVSVWVKVGVRHTGSILSLSDSNDASSDYSMRFRVDNGKIDITVRENAVRTLFVQTPTALDDGNWHHVVFTVKAGIGNNFYVDGSQVSPTYVDGNGSTDNWFSAISNINHISLGTNRDSVGLEWLLNGILDDVRIYNRALSSTEVEALYKTRRKRVSGSLANGLVAHYEMDDSGIGHVAGEAHDKSGNNNHGEFKNFSNIVTNGFSTNIPTQIGTGTSLKFDGINDYVSINPIIPSLVTISAWVNFNSVTSTPTIAGQRNNIGTFWSAYLLRLKSGKLSFLLQKPNLNVISEAIGTTNINAGIWYHVVAVFNGSATSIYLDGNLDGYDGTVSESSLKYSATQRNFGIGAVPNGSSGAWEDFIWGEIDDVRVYSRALTTPEVSFLYNGSGLNPGTANLVGHWDLDDSAVKDSSGNNNHGIGVGGASLKYTEGVLRR